MRLDPIVSRRFLELQQKAEAVSVARKASYTTNAGDAVYAVSSELFKEWATNVLSLLHRSFGQGSIHYQNFSAHYHKFLGWESDFRDCHAIFKAAREDYEGGYLFNIRTLAKAEVLADAIEQAKELLQAGYKDPACILARVSLEVALKDLADRFQVTLSTLDRMNADLCKAGAYNMAKQKQITAWAEIGNKAAHGEWAHYTDQDAAAMVGGVEALVADL